MLTGTLARLVAETPAGAITAAMRDRAAQALVDTLGCAIAGAHSDAAEIALRVTGSPGPSTLWGRHARLAPPDAAFVNATAGHAQDFDDSLPILRGHPSVPLLAAGLAVAGRQRVSGRDLLDAYVIGVEIAGRLGRTLDPGHYTRGWHSTATVGAFTAAAMAGRLMGLDAARMRHAFGFAAADSGGLLRNFGSMAKALQVGRSARAGLLAADLAAEGATADASILDGPGGFLDVYGGRAPVPGEAGWAILDPGIYVKRWPCCYAVHRALAGIFALAGEHGIAAGEVKRLRVGFMPDADKALVHTDPRTGLEAKFSIEYCAAAAILDGRVTLASFDDAAVRRPDVRALMARVERFAMPGQGSFSGVHGETEVEIVTGRGSFATRVVHTPGSPQAPVSEANRRDKFLGCATPVLGPAAEGLLAALAAIDAAEDVDAVLQLAVPRERAA